MLGRLFLRSSGIAAAAWLGAVNCSGNTNPYVDRVPLEQIQNVRHLSTGLPLPPSATDVWNLDVRFQDAQQLLRFDAAPAEARRFVRAVLRRDPVPGEPGSRIAFLRDHWWLHSYPAGGEGGHYEDGHAIVDVVMAPVDGRMRVWVFSGDDCEELYACVTHFVGWPGKDSYGRSNLERLPDP